MPTSAVFVFLVLIAAGALAAFFKELDRKTKRGRRKSRDVDADGEWTPPAAMTAEPPRDASPPAADAYTASTSLLSSAERTFLHALDQALPPNTRVHIQVAMSAIVSPRRGSPTWQRDRNRIAQKIADFVVCDQWSKPLAVIELDDASHKRASRADRDAELDSIFRNVGLRLIHVRAAGSYDVEALRAELSPTASAR